MFLKTGKESSPLVMEETEGLEIIEIVDNADSLDEHRVSLFEVMIWGESSPRLEQRQTSVQVSEELHTLMNQSQSPLLKLLIQWLPLMNKSRNCFENFEKGNSLMTIVLKPPQI